MSGKQIKLFLVDGTPGGLTTAEITNWTGHVLQIVLPVLGVNAIRVRPSVHDDGVSRDATESPVFHLRNTKAGVDARAQQIDGEFTMLEGSLVVAVWHGVGKAESTIRAYASYRAHHEQLLAEGALVAQGDSARLIRDVVFSSPSTAGAVALGRSCNGRVEWVAGDGRSFGVWESRGVD